MGLFDKRTKKLERELGLVKEILIQASSEGSKSQVDIESLLTATNVSGAMPGITNGYSDYDSQTEAIYDKYNGFDMYGNQMVRTVIDYRTAFIAGEGISISCKNEKTAAWIEGFIKDNKLKGSNLINMVKGSEMAGQAIVILDNDKEEGKVSLYRKAYNTKSPYRAVFDPLTGKLVEIQVRNKGVNVNWVTLDIKDYVYTRIGGDDRPNQSPTSKVGIVLTDIENYDRATKDMRRNNHIFARITPVFEVQTDGEAKTLADKLRAMRWRIGTAFIGKAKFHYEVPKTSVHENLTSELVSTIKTISSITGVPVHWLGYVDLMSNRSTAESLYEMIKNATLTERTKWEETLYDIIIKAQTMHIDDGGKVVTFDPDFEVKLPLIDFSGFLDMVRALSLAYKDQAISMDDYRNNIPGTDPLVTAKAVEAESVALEQQLVKMGLTNINNEEGENDG